MSDNFESLRFLAGIINRLDVNDEYANLSCNHCGTYHKHDPEYACAHDGCTVNYCMQHLRLFE